MRPAGGCMETFRIDLVSWWALKGGGFKNAYVLLNLQAFKFE